MAVDPVRNQYLVENVFNNNVQRKNGSLGKNEFLNLLVTQLKYQDPLAPMDDKEFIAQMAQFSSLEQMTNMNETFSSMKAFSLVGKHVTANIIDGSTRQMKTVEGDVSSVKMSQGKAYVVVGDREVAVDDVVDIRDIEKADPPEKLINLLGMIGRQATSRIVNSDNKTGNIVGLVRSVSTENGVNYAQLDNVLVDVVGISDTDTTALEPDEIKEYLDNNVQKYVKVTVKDQVNNVRFQVQGLVRQSQINEAGQVVAILDDVRVEVDSINDLAYVVIDTGTGSGEEGTT